MAIRIIREIGDEILTKKSKEVKEITPRLKELIEDMKETMYDEGGVGIAAPQVGVLKRIVVIDIADEEEEPDLHVFINPVITERSEEEENMKEACLSVPGKCGPVLRPKHVKVEALNEDMEPFEMEADGILARALCHETDHLEGILYTDRLNGPLEDMADEEEEELQRQERQGKKRGKIRKK